MSSAAQTSDATPGPTQARKVLIFFAPMALLMMAGTWYAVVPEFLGTLNDLAARAPSVRIGAADPVALAVFPFLAGLLVALVLKALPAAQATVDRVVRWVHVLLILAAVLLVLGVPAIKLLQSVAMPRLGYASCNQLDGQPTFWFNDWVRDPAWCVSGKSRAWVNEQAAQAPR